MGDSPSFSKRNNYGSGPKAITIREDAPENLRYIILQIAEDLGYAPSTLRSVLCRVLRVPPDAGNWSEYPNIQSEIEGLIYRCDWYKVYDIIEALHASFVQNDSRRHQRDAPRFSEDLNEFFEEEGIGWQLINGVVITRGTEVFESVLSTATRLLEESSKTTAAKHLKEAVSDLSRRPKPELHGAIYHAMGALECVARDVTRNPKATLGEILKSTSDVVPRPLDTALSQIWGYASNEARHVQEGREPNRDEAELIVGLSATITTYLSRKFGGLPFDHP